MMGMMMMGMMMMAVGLVVMGINQSPIAFYLSSALIPMFQPLQLMMQLPLTTVAIRSPSATLS